LTSNTLENQALALPDVIRNASKELAETSRLILSTPDHYAMRGMLMCGSGDSLVAGRGAQLAWESLSGIPTYAQDAMTVARYRGSTRADTRPFSPLVVVLSNSGEVARVVEAAVHSRTRGCRVMAITGNETSRLADVADIVWPLPSCAPTSGPGVHNVALMLLALYHLAIRSGEVRGRYTMDHAEMLRRELDSMAEDIARTVELAAEPARSIADKWADVSHVEILGSGPSRASAAFSAAKIVEAAGLASYDQDIEEFVHQGYFSRNTNIATLLISGSNASVHSRSVEVGRLLMPLDRPTATLSDKPLAGLHLPHVEGVREFWHTLLHLAPTALLAGEMMRLRGEEPFRGSSGQWSGSAGAATTRNSSIQHDAPTH
jgi:glucosamine--fructose-6-phosphate aminotransferase (isomerizing)